MGGGNPTDEDYEMVTNPADNVIANGGSNNQQSKPILDNSDGRKLEALWNENIKLQTQVEDMRSIVMEQINESIQGQAHYVEYELMKQYLPKDSQDVDYRGISVLALIQKILYKAKACRGLLERFYNDPSSATLKNPALATMSHGLCPRILAVENYIRAIQEGFLSIATDKDDEWKNKVSRFNSSGSHRILESFDELLTAIEKAPNTNELNFELETLEKHKKLLKDFIEKQFAEFSPERPKKDEYRCSKNIVLQNMSETHYRFQSLSLQLNQFNAKLFDLVYAPGNTTSSSAVPIEDDNKYEENGLASQDDDSIFKELKIGAVEKLFRLTNGIIADTAQILQYCQPVELGYAKLQHSKNLLKDANRTSIKWGQLTRSKYISGRAKERVSQMLEAIKQIRRFDSKKINEIIAKEEEFNEKGEANEDGLINILEKAETIISEVRKIIGSTLYTTEKSTDNMQDTTYEEVNEPYWENYSAKFRLLFEQQRENEIKMKELEEGIKQANEKVIIAEKSQKQKEQTITILTEQNIIEKDKSKALSETQKENIELRETKEKLSKKVLEQAQKVSVQEEEIANKSAAIEKYKKAIQRIKDKDNPLGSRDKPVHIRQETVPTGVSNGVSGPKGSAINIGRGGKYLVNTSTEIEYSQLLQQTIQSLRRKVTELMMDKKLTNCKLNLKPLPFTLLRDKVISNLNAELSNKPEKKKKRVKKEKIIKEQKEKPSVDEEDGKEESKDNKDETENNEENKEAEESEYEWVTDDEDDIDELRAAKQAQLMKLQREKEMTEKMQNELNSLSTNLDDIRSKPMIIDLTKKSKRNNDLSQDIIGRQMKLRDVHLQCQQMKEDITRRVEEQNRENIKNDDYVQINNTENKQELGEPIATIEIPNSSLKSLGYDRTHKVRLPPQRFDRLQTSFLW